MPIKTLRFTTGVRIVLASAAFSVLALPIPISAHEGHGLYVHRSEPVHFQSSVQISQETANRAAQAGREAYSAVLHPFAKVSADMAKKTALSVFADATLRDVSLHVIHSNLVYLALLTKGESRHLVVIDAGNGKVLATRDMPLRHHSMHRLMWQE